MTDDLMTRTEARRVQALAALDRVGQARLGQFFTPMSAAALIAGLPRLPQSGCLRVLDPGAGTGSLTAALVHRALMEAPKVRVEVVAVEVDPHVSSYLSATLADCEATASAAGQSLTTRIIDGDFIQLSIGSLESKPAFEDPFDLVIMNPPYAKLAANSRQRMALLRQGVDCPNLYAAFLALGVEALAPHGQLVAITPRSFANGTYFEQFRKFLLRNVSIDQLHAFESRSTLFSDTGVLQENIVLSGTRDGVREKVLATMSRGDADVANEYIVNYDEVVSPDDPHQFLRIGAGNAGTNSATATMASMPATLHDLGLQVSTGRVVDFRSRENLKEAAGDACVPLVYPGNVRGGIVEWPRSIRKPQGFEVLAEADRKLLLPSGCYVLVKRFSAKEERRRIVAAIWDPKTNGDQDIAFENHLNVFHSKCLGIDHNLAIGLSLWLNSTLVDNYFRTFSGHTQVNAGDLRSLRFPSAENMRGLGIESAARLPDQSNIDSLVASYLIPQGDAGVTDATARRINQARQLLGTFGFDRERTNERSALVLLGLLQLKPDDSWSDSTNPMLGTRAIMDWIGTEYGVNYAPNTRETIRRFSLHQFASALLIEQNPDQLDRPVNSPKWCYQIHPRALRVIRALGTPEMPALLADYLVEVPGLKIKYDAARDMHRIPVTLPSGIPLTLSPGGQNNLIKQMAEGFCSYYAPGGQVLYVGDADAKWAIFEKDSLASLGVTVDQHGKMPDLVVYLAEKNWLFLMEAASSHGPVDANRQGELAGLFAASTAGLMYVSCFPSRPEMRKYLADIAWESEVWCADNPTHLIHFNGERFLGPYS